MKKLLSLLLALTMLSSVCAFAQTEITHTFKADDGTVYHFGTFAETDEDAGLVINGKNYTLKEGTHECDTEDCANAFVHAKNNGCKFGMGIKLADVYQGTTYTMAPYSTDYVGSTETIDITTVPEVEADDDTVYDQVAFTVSEMAYTVNETGERTTMDNTSSSMPLQPSRTGEITFTFNDLKGITSGEKVYLTLYGYVNSNVTVAGTFYVYDNDMTEVCGSAALPIYSNGDEGSAATSPIEVKLDVTEYVKEQAGKTSLTFKLTMSGDGLKNNAKFNIFIHTPDKAKYEKYAPTLTYDPVRTVE